MIRFVDLRFQGTGYRFAFWETVSDRFIESDGEQAWDDSIEFHNSAHDIDENTYQRCVSLMPDWAHRKACDREMGFFDDPCTCDGSCVRSWRASP